MNFKNLCLSMALVVCAYGTPLYAESVYNANVRVEFVSDAAVIIPGGDFWIGLKMTMDDHWHTYWRNPGDSGMATRIKWQLPDGFEAGELHWPYPDRVDYMEDLTSYVLGGQVILLTKIKAPVDINVGETKQINAKVSWLSCEKICVPGRAQLSIDFIVGAGNAQKEEAVHRLFVEEKKRWPVLDNSWEVSAIEDDDTFLFNVHSNNPRSSDITEMAFFPYRNDVVDHAKEQILKGQEGRYELTVRKSTLLEENIDSIEGVLVAREGWQKERGKQGLFVDVPVKK